uniref:Uncharacterized protein n=1 Tax=Davidia involucrata TaxID=16924 RepID=A0A5B7AMT1_DAVIN
MAIYFQAKPQKQKAKNESKIGCTKNLDPNISISERVSPRRLLSESTEETVNKKQKEGGVKKKLKPNLSSSVRISPIRASDASKPQIMVKNGNLLSKETKKEAKSKARDQDGMQRKLTPNNPSALALSPKTLQTTVRNGNLLSKKAVEEAKSRSPKQGGVQEKLKSNGSEPATTLLGKSQELSARRTKVMQSLGLISPSGSPFHRNGHIYPKPVLHD